MSQDLIVPDHARTMFGNSFRQAVEQKTSRLRNLVTVKTGCTGDSYTVDIEAEATAGEDVTGQRYKDVEIVDIKSGIRHVLPREYQKPTHESKWDPNSIAPLVSGAGRHTLLHQTAFGKFCDTLLLTNILGTVLETDATTGTPTARALPASQKIAKDFVYEGSPTDGDLTIEKLLRALQLLEENEVWGADQMEAGMKICIATNSRANKDLLRSVNSGLAAKLLSKDFMPPTLDANGHISQFLGINFVRTELVAKQTVSGVNCAILPLWVSSCVEMGFWSDLSVTIDRLPQKSNALQFLSQARIGAARIEDKGVVQITCAQPAI